MPSKVISPNDFASYIDSIKSKKVVFTNGCFDILHPGHISYLEQARALGDLLIVGLNSDRSVKQLKGEKRPIFNQKERAANLSGLTAVDAIIIFDEETPISLISKVKPSIHVKGGDYEKHALPEYKTVVENGGDVTIVPFEKGLSSTDIVQRILNLYRNNKD